MSSKYNEVVFANQVPLVNLFARHLIHHRVLRSALEGREFSSPFWADTATAHILQACGLWCMVFGNPNPNRTHVKKLRVENSKRDFEDEFSKGVSQHLGISVQEWNDYKTSVIAFRDQYVAHRDLVAPPVPLLDQALEAAFFYDAWVRELIAPHTLDMPDLRYEYDVIRFAVTAEVAAAVGHGASL